MAPALADSSIFRAVKASTRSFRLPAVFHFLADYRMSFHLPIFGVAEAIHLEQKRVGNADLADVVQLSVP
jgi:hypothetical protein